MQNGGQCGDEIDMQNEGDADMCNAGSIGNSSGGEIN